MSDGVNKQRQREREGGEEREGVKEKRMWPTVKDDWRGVELCLIIDPAVSCAGSGRSATGVFHIAGYLQDKQRRVRASDFILLCVCASLVVSVELVTGRRNLLCQSHRSLDCALESCCRVCVCVCEKL